MLRKDANDFLDPCVKLREAPYLGPILMDNQSPVQWIYEQRLLPEPVRNLLFSAAAV